MCLPAKIPGQATEYSLVSGTSITPPPEPGVTVRYSVRTTTNGSAWSTERSITYASGPGTTDTQAAPKLSVSGQALTWSAVGNVNTYVLVRRVPGQADQYSVVGGTSITSASVPGATGRLQAFAPPSTAARGRLKSRSHLPRTPARLNARPGPR